MTLAFWMIKIYDTYKTYDFASLFCILMFS